MKLQYFKDVQNVKELKKQYHNIYRFLDEVSQMTEKKYEYKLSDSDRIYLIIHLARVLKKRP